MTILQTLLLAVRWSALKALCLFVWVSFHPSFAHPPKNAEAIATAIADATLFDSEPVFGDAEHETAVAAEYAVRESWLVTTAIGDHGEAFGVFQLHNVSGKGTPAEQTGAWLAMLHRGAVICPASPAAPLSGGCHTAHKLADRRVKVAFEALDSFSRSFPQLPHGSEESQETAAAAAHPKAAFSAGGTDSAL